MSKNRQKGRCKWYFIKQMVRRKTQNKTRRG